jgi:DNA polymerase (family 10)
VTPFEFSVLLRRLGDYAEIRGASQEAMAWRRLAGDLDRLGSSEHRRLTDLVHSDSLGHLTTLPTSLHWKLRDIVVDGPEMADVSPGSIPWLLERLLALRRIDSAQAAALARLGIVTLDDLATALDDGRIAAHLPDTEAGLRGAVGALARERLRLSLGRALDFAENLILLVAAACPDVEGLIPAGDVRRFEPIVEALVIVGFAPDPPATLERICRIPMIQCAVHLTGRRALVRYQQAEIDVRIVTRDEYGSALHLATGSAAHVAAIRSKHRATRVSAREEDVYSHAGLAWIAPELRQATGEVEAAASGSLPRLVARSDIRGDLHMHTTYSDGRDSLSAMVHAAAALGYEYIAITDHSARAGASRTVTVDALARQRDDIARLQEGVPAMTILHGIEVDIMPDGRLDFDDHVLASLDIVLASLHDRAGHDAHRLTRRCLGAIRHPLVTIITHPANRLVGRDPGYDLDFPAIFAAAVETGTALEIDGAPSHLDMDGEHARAAIAAGATVSIDSDCHRASLLDRQMRLGLGTARRGWVEGRQVLNARPLSAVRAFIEAKRGTRR